MSKPRSANLPAIAMIVVTGAACIAALVFRTPLRSRVWAARLIESNDPAERARYLSALCNAGDAGRWGTAKLLDHETEAVRSAGVIVLQNVRGDWSRGKLVEMLSDTSRNVRELAALGLAIHGDDGVIPRLLEMFAGSDASSVGAACVALERLATPAAIRALTELAASDATVVQRAHLIDALAGIGLPECVPPLTGMLNDHRPCSIPTRSAQLALGALSAAADIPEMMQLATSKPAAPGPATIAERAAEALMRITGLTPPFGSDHSEAERESAARVWSSWTPENRP